MKTTRLSSSRQPKRHTGGRWRTCFIAAPFGVNLNTIKTLLEERGMKPLVSSELKLIGVSLLEHVTRTISQVDLLIAILDPKQFNANVYYELGYAHALGKRLLVLAPPELKSIPADLTGLLYVRADAENREAIGFALDQVLAAPKPPKQKPSQPVEMSQPIGQLAEQLKDKLKSLGSRVDERDVEKIVLSALRASGISILAGSVKPDIGADIAIWADELRSSVGSPFLIEIKTHLRDRAHIMQVSHQVSTYLEKSNACWALVLYLKGPPIVADLPVFTSHARLSNILLLGVHEFLDRLKTSSSGEIIRDLWNRRVHGSF